MVEKCVGPSEFHLKKELSALRKARFLRDPETCSSWRSHLSSRSLAVTYGLNHGNGTRGNITGLSSSSGLLELPSTNDDNKKKVFLYNWRHHSSKSSDNGTKLSEDNRQESPEASPEDSCSSASKVDSRSDTYLDVPGSLYCSRGRQPEIPVRKSVRKSHRSSNLRKRTVPVKKLPDHPSSSVGVANPVEPSDDIEYCNSEDLKHATHDLIQRNGYLSRSASPLFSGSGCQNWSRASKVFQSTRREESSHSYTPASASSYNRYGVRNPSTVGSWDGTTSFDEDELDQMDLARGQGSGVPRYRPKRTKDMGCGGWYSPSLSDTLRKGSSILCGRQKFYNKKRLSASQKQKYLLNASQGLPLLSNSCNECSSSEEASDELSTNLGELDLEALSRLDGRRWSSCKSHDGLDLAFPCKPELEIHDNRSLSQKYRPRSFDEIIGQNIVVQSLGNAISRARIAPAYLFHGPRGTGKTSTARVFSAALNCMSIKDKKPCGFCKECNDFSSGNGLNVIEVEATNKKSMDRIRYLLKNMSIVTKFSRYKVFIIDECHMLSSKLWSTFMKFLEEPPPRVVFIFITIDPENLPSAILSRCQKFLFPKIKDADMICRLRMLSVEENLDVELDALDLVASNSDGSLRDAETMLDQLSLLGKKITASLVNDLVGVVPEEKLLDLLEIAMSSDTSETVKRSRELMDSGVDPMALMSQLAALIMDIIAGTYQLANSQSGGTVLGLRSLTEAELERLQQALKILSDAEKQLRLSSERSTWFTAALLQLGSGHAVGPPQSSNSSKQSTKIMNNDALDGSGEILLYKGSSPQAVTHQSNSALVPRITSGHSSPHGTLTNNNFLSSQLLPVNNQYADQNLVDATDMDTTTKTEFGCISSGDLAEIWRRCIEKCHSKTLRQLLYAHGKLVSITESDGMLVAFIGFVDEDVKSRAERFLSSITNSVEIVLRHNVEVRMGLMQELYAEGKSVSVLLARDHREKNRKLLAKNRVDTSNEINSTSDKVGEHGSPNSNFPRKSLDFSGGMITQRKHDVLILTSEDDRELNDHEPSIQRTHTVSIDEQRLENAWLQATAEKGPPGSLSHLLRPEKNQVLPQSGASCHSCNGSSAAPIPLKHWEDKLNQQIKALKVCNIQDRYSEKVSERVDHYAISPSLLHSDSLEATFEKESLGYESGAGCNAIFCWNTRKPPRPKGKQGTHIRSQRTACLSLCEPCGKSKSQKNKLGR